MTKREKVESFIIEYIKKITKSEENVNLYKNLFKSMSDSEFHTFMEDLRDNKKHLSVIIPPNLSYNVTVNNNLKIAKELGHDFFQRLIIKNEDGLPDVTTPQKYLIYHLPIKRAVQYLDKKISIAEDNKTIDSTTGQAAGKSKTRKITYPETQVLSGYGLKSVLQELLQARGGDIRQGNALDTMLFRTGTADLKTLSNYKSKVRSTEVLAQYLNAMHIRSTL